MKKFLVVAAAMVLAGLVSTAMAQDHARKVGLGTVDRDVLGKELGWTDAVNSQAQADVNFAKAQIADLKNRLDQGMVNAKRQIGVKLGKVDEVMKTTDAAELLKLGVTKEQLDQLAQMIGQSNQLLQQVDVYYRQVLQQRQQELDRQYGRLLKPHARKVAEDLGLAAVVMMPSDAMLFTDPSIDITLKVCDGVRAAKETAPTLPPMPALKFNEQAAP
jgi:Skp family chaperone for outer membrane proteins